MESVYAIQPKGIFAIFETTYTKQDLLSYYGMLIGAGATILAVSLTIKYSADMIGIQLKDNASQIQIPFFIISGVECKGNLSSESAIKLEFEYEDDSWNNVETIEMSEKNDVEVVLDIFLKNIGEGVAINTNQNYDGKVILGEKSTIPKDGKYNLSVFENIRTDSQLVEFDVNGLFQEKTIYYDLFYSNIRGVRYRQCIPLTFKVRGKNTCKYLFMILQNKKLCDF